jgi:hypothetical protein
VSKFEGGKHLREMQHEPSKKGEEKGGALFLCIISHFAGFLFPACKKAFLKYF